MSMSRFLLFILIGTMGLTSCTKPTEEKKAQPALRLPITSAQAETITDQLILPGVVLALPDRSVKVSPGVAAKLHDVKVVPGQQVTQGQLIAVLDSRQLAQQVSQAHAKVLQTQAAVDQAITNLLLAEDTEKRNARLVQQEIGAQKDLVAAKSQVETAKTQIEAAKAQVKEAVAAEASAKVLLGYSLVKSPITGTVAQRFLNKSDSADTTTPIVEVVDLSQVIVDVAMPTTEPADIKPGQNAIVRSKALPDDKLTGIVQSIAPITDNQGTTISVRILCGNPDFAFKEGMPVTAIITTAVHRNATTVPLTALVSDPSAPDKKMVYLYQDGKVKRTSVTTGIQSNNRVEVLTGLNPGQSVVASGAYGIPDDTEVQAQSEAVR
jgi:cobalt-zinc-cadmium efflux system membrane fusion protein